MGVSKFDGGFGGPEFFGTPGLGNQQDPNYLFQGQ